MEIHAVPHAASTVSLSSIASSAPSFSDEPTLDCGIKLEPCIPLNIARVLDLHPTQLAVGMQQVQKKMEKAAKKRAKGAEKLDAFLKSNPIPVVLGPGSKAYLIDHHHLACALYKLGIPNCYIGVAKDLSHLEGERFWKAMADERLVWLHDSNGQPVQLEQMEQLLPETVAGLNDDPYRSLAALVRKAGGYTKSTRPFSEFMWANHLRGLVPMVLMSTTDVESYVGKALSHATAPEAGHMPGYSPLEELSCEQLDMMAAQGQEGIDEE